MKRKIFILVQWETQRLENGEGEREIMVEGKTAYSPCSFFIPWSIGGPREKEGEGENFAFLGGRSKVALGHSR